MIQRKLPDRLRTYNIEAKTAKLRRRTKIRRLLTSRQGLNGLSTINQIAEEIGAYKNTVQQDLVDIGAVRLSERINGKYCSWWTIPAWNPAASYMKDIDLVIVENTVAKRIADHVIDVIIQGTNVILTTERAAGPLVSEWLSLLTWEGMVYVQEQRNAAIIHCSSLEMATLIHGRITGYDPGSDGEESSGESEIGLEQDGTGGEGEVPSESEQTGLLDIDE